MNEQIAKKSLIDSKKKETLYQKNNKKKNPKSFLSKILFKIPFSLISKIDQFQFFYGLPVDSQGIPISILNNTDYIGSDFEKHVNNRIEESVENNSLNKTNNNINKRKSNASSCPTKLSLNQNEAGLL